MTQGLLNKNDKLRKNNSINLFKEAAKRVPAYKDFLKTNKINPNKINTWEDFLKVPHVNKKNYLRKYPLRDLCWDGSLNKPLVFSSTSSSTGKPFYFARSENIDHQSSWVYESFLKQNVLASGGSTLVIICFGMGVWIGGIIAYESFKRLSCKKDYPISMITPGINKKEIFEALRGLASNYDQVVLVGYPPFIKDIIDECSDFDINLKKLNLKLIFAAEVFTEKFRDYVVEKAGIKNPYLDIMNIYGTADMGTMAWETGVATLIKRLSLQDEALFSHLFPESGGKIPTIAQYNPKHIDFEAPGEKILLTGDNIIPLVRYSLGDRGGVISFNDVVQILKKDGYNLKDEAEKAGISDYLSKLPFVYVYERLDFSTTIYGLQVYPEMVRDSLLHDHTKEYLTGKFNLLTKFDDNHNQYLEINIELKKNIESDEGFKGVVTEKIMSHLSGKSSEFRELHAHLKERAVPKIIFWPFEHPTHFSPGVKQKWVK